LTRPGGTQKERRRVIQIGEVLKDKEGSFNDLVRFDELEDKLVPVEGLQNSSERISKIARSWGMTVRDAYENIEARSKMRERIVTTALEKDKPALLEAPWVIRTNNIFRQLIERQHLKGVGSREVLQEWEKWFAKSAGYA
ncbi:MAG: hypothetical protein ACE5IO_08385, partial [Thermoplasmata archaeon]